MTREEIWLQIDYPVITWSEDQQTDRDVKYIRSDIVADEIKELEQSIVDGSDELMEYITVNEKLKRRVNELEGERKLFKKRDFVCKGAGQCDYDGTECNEKNHCGEYEPIEEVV